MRDLMETVSEEEYKQIAKNVLKLSDKLIKGEYMKKALDKAISLFGGKINMVWILPLIIVAFLVLNYKIGKHDYMYPPFLYSFVFLVSSLVCALGAEFYSISLSGNTVLIIVFSLLLFTI